MTDFNIGFIGGGNMSRSLIGGLIADGVPAENIHVAEPDDQQRQRLTADFGVRTSRDNDEVAATADVLVLAVKPQVLHSVAEGMAGTVRARRPLIVSVAAGVRAADIDGWLGGGLPVVRTMPNTPALVQSGATGLYANDRVDAAQRDQAETIMRAVGLTLWVADESALDAVTGVSGSGPAYFFLVIEALEAAGVEAGLEHESARLLALQTAFGAAKMALESPDEPATLRERVTSPGGTTERALEVLEQGDLRGLFREAVAAARQRAGELADLLGEH